MISLSWGLIYVCPIKGIIKMRKFRIIAKLFVNKGPDVGHFY